MVASDRIEKWIHTLTEAGHSVTLVSGGLKDLKPECLQSVTEPDRLRIIRVSFSKYLEPNYLYQKNYTFPFNILSKFFTALLYRLFSADFGAGWLWPLSVAIKKLLQDEKYDLIISSGGPFLPFYVIRKLAIQHGIQYILDYRDTWSETILRHTGQISIFAKWIEKVVNKDAIYITTVSEGCKAAISKHSNNQRFKIIYNFPSIQYAQKLQVINSTMERLLPLDKLKVVFTGSIGDFGSNRTFIPVLNAFNTLCEEERNKIVFIYCGPSSAIVKKYFAILKLEDYLLDFGMLSKQDAIGLVTKADVCLSIIFDSKLSGNIANKGVISTKIFDYVLLNKIILNVCPDDNELHHLQKKYQLEGFYNYNGSQQEEITLFFKQLIQGNLRGSVDNADRLYWENQDFSFIEI
jgi:hypothetical protein